MSGHKNTKRCSRLQTTELLAMINLAELGSDMEIEEECLLTSLEDFEQALRDFDRLLRALVVSINKYNIYNTRSKSCTHA